MKLKKKVRRLERRVDLLQDALNDLTDRWLGVSPTPHLAVVEDAPVYAVECPVCKGQYMPILRDGVEVLGEHPFGTYTAEQGIQYPKTCSGSNMPVSNIDAELTKGD